MPFPSRDTLFCLHKPVSLSRSHAQVPTLSLIYRDRLPINYRDRAQAQLAERIGILQTLVTDYEHDRLRLSAEMAVRFALALGVSLDEWLLPKPPASTRKKKRPLISRAVRRRMEILDLLPRHRRRDLLTVLDTHPQRRREGQSARFRAIRQLNIHRLKGGGFGSD